MSTTAERHLTDAELMRVLDDEERSGSDGERERAHVTACDRCATALATLRAESRLLTEWLERAAFEAVPDREAGRAAVPAGPGLAADARAVPPVRSRSTSWLRAAAVLLLMAAPLAALPGVRAWVVERVAPAPEVTEAPATGRDAVVLRFTPTPGGFDVRFPVGSAGLLALERSPGQEAELRAEGGAPETVVSATALEIRNDAAGRYELRLPMTVTGAWVYVGDRAVAVTDTQIERGTVIDLGAGRVR